MYGTCSLTLPKKAGVTTTKGEEHLTKRGSGMDHTIIRILCKSKFTITEDAHEINTTPVWGKRFAYCYKEIKSLKKEYRERNKALPFRSENGRPNKTID